MLKYLTNISGRLANLKSGMEKNLEKWSQMPEDPLFVQSFIDEIKSKDKEIEELKNVLSRKYSEARAISREKQSLIVRLEKRAIGIHAEDPGKLNEYGIVKNK